VGISGLIIQYVLLAGVVVVAARIAGALVDEFDQRTKISGALIGGILLAAITSLPEFITSIVSTVVYDQPGLAFGNIFGSNFFNLVILAVLDLYFLRKYLYNKIQDLTKVMNLVNITYFIVLLPFVINIFLNTEVFGPQLDNQFFFIVTNATLLGFSLMSVTIMVMYYLSARSLHLASSSSEVEDDDEDEPGRFGKFSQRALVGLFAVTSVVLIAGAYFLTGTTNNIAIQTGLNASFVGALFLGIATSLPELASVYTLVKLGNFNAAAGGIIGSNMFNFTIIAVVDAFVDVNVISLITNDPLISTNALTLLVLGLINGIILLLAMNRKVRKKPTLFYAVPSVLIITNYLAYLILSFV
jgi:cation:H+ antiporter